MNEAIELHPVEAGDAGRRDLGQQRLIQLGRFDRFRAIGQDVALGVEEFAAVVEEEVGPQRHVGVAQAAPDEAEGAFLGSVSFSAAATISSKVFGTATPFFWNSSLL